MNHDELYYEIKRELAVNHIKDKRELAELRATIVAKYGEERVAKKDRLIREEWERDIEKFKGAV